MSDAHVTRLGVHDIFRRGIGGHILQGRLARALGARGRFVLGVVHFIHFSHVSLRERELRPPSSRALAVQER